MHTNYIVNTEFSIIYVIYALMIYKKIVQFIKDLLISDVLLD